MAVRCALDSSFHALIRRWSALLAIALLPALVACSLLGGEEAATSTPPAAVTVTLTPTATPEPTTTPSPTPIAPRVVIDDQPLDDSGVLTAAEVSLPGPGWLVIFREDDGEVGEAIGQTALAGGIHDAVSVTVETSLATETLYARLHLDAGAEAVFEFPGEDEPYPGEPGATFAVVMQIPRPVIEADEQTVGEDNIVTLTYVEVLEPSWVVIHADENGEAGQVLGRVRLEAGVHENVTITIDRRYATPTLYAVLHEDDGEPNVLEYPQGDRPILVNGEAVVTTFTAHFPPEILVYDQPLVDGAVIIERVISEGPGWVAVYSDQEGQPGLIIGFAALEDGLNQAVPVELIESAVTPRLYARLHEDTTPDNEFNFPAEDPVVRYEERMPQAAAFRTDQGALVMVHDQALSDDGVVIHLVIVPVDAWVAVHAAGEDGLPAGMLGRTFVPAGMNREVVVALEPTPGDETVFLVLYEDLGEAERFEALGVDPLLTNPDNRLIRVPFHVASAGDS